MRKVGKLIEVSNLRGELIKLKGKKIQVVTKSGKHIRGFVKSVGKDFVVIQGQRLTRSGVRTSVFFPFFLPFTSLLFFSPFFFPFF